MPVSNVSLRERPPQHRTEDSSGPTERDDLGASARRPRPPTNGLSPARNRAKWSPVRIIVGLGIYTAAVAASAIMATELMANGRPVPAGVAAPQQPAQAPVRTQVLGPRPSEVAPAPPAAAPAPDVRSAPVRRPTGKTGRAAARLAGNGDVASGTGSSNQVWNRLAACESSGNWSDDTGNGYYGGLQFKPSTWRSFGGLAYAAAADNATRTEQITVARRVLGAQGWQAWPACSRKTGLRAVPVKQVLGGHSAPAAEQTSAAHPAAPHSASARKHHPEKTPLHTGQKTAPHGAHPVGAHPAGAPVSTPSPAAPTPAPPNASQPGSQPGSGAPPAGSAVPPVMVWPSVAALSDQGSRAVTGVPPGRTARYSY